MHRSRSSRGILDSYSALSQDQSAEGSEHRSPGREILDSGLYLSQDQGAEGSEHRSPGREIRDSGLHLSQDQSAEGSEHRSRSRSITSEGSAGSLLRSNIQACDTACAPLEAAELGLLLKAKLSADMQILSETSFKFVHPTPPLLQEHDHRSVLPLPVPSLSLEEQQWKDSKSSRRSQRFRGAGALKRAAGAAAWLWILVVTLNALYTGTGGGTARDKCNASQKRAMDLLAKDAGRFCTSGGSTGDLNLNWEEELLKKTDYWGEPMYTARPLSLEQVLPSLPPSGTAGMVAALDLLEGRTRDQIADPESCLLPRSCWPSSVPQGRSQIEKGQEEVIASALVESGVCGLIEAEQIFAVDGRPVVNSFFGVEKPNKTLTDGRPILRLIMNLVPTNAYQRAIKGDVRFLPYLGQLCGIVIADGQELLISQEDMSCAFYVFELPVEWQPFFSFDLKLRGKHLDRYREAVVQSARPHASW